jgi:hypothetical protein
LHRATVPTHYEYDEQYKGLGVMDAHGEWRGWGWGVPGCFRALNAPGSGAAIPAVPTERDPHAQTLGYWGALHYLLLYRLGWTEPHRGLQTWVGGKLNEEDDTTSLVRRIWIAEHTLEVYHCWSLLAQRRFDIAAGTSTADVDDARPEARAFRRAGEVMLEKPETSRFPWFTPNSGDPLHLQSHFLHDPAQPIAAKLFKHQPAEQRATLLVADSRWYTALLQHQDQLPMRGMHSWKVDVYVDSLGKVGTFRRSAATGLWFTGKHSTHMQGNP